MIEPIDSLEIAVIVDNVTDNLSSNPKYVETEVAGAWRRGMKWLGGKCLCCAAHGLSCLITTRIGDTSHSLLFDTGPDEWVFERNIVRLGLDLGKVGAMAMPRALQMITLANGREAFLSLTRERTGLLRRSSLDSPAEGHDPAIMASLGPAVQRGSEYSRYFK